MKTKIRVGVCLLCSALFIILMFHGKDIYSAVIPTVDCIGIGPAFLNEKRYPYTVPTEYIYEDNNGTYTVLIRKHSTFWYDYYTIEKTYLDIVLYENGHSAVEFPNNDYRSSDMLYIGDVTKIKCGSRVQIHE